jgi:hypothetical protein
MLSGNLLMPVRSSSRRRLLALAVAVFASLLYAAPVLAQAQIVVVNEQSLPRLDRDGKQVGKRPLPLNPEVVNFQDCKDDQQIQFTLQMSGFQADAVIQVWAANSGVDCGVPTNRQGPAQLCWQASQNVPLQQLVDVRIPVRRIMSGVTPFQPTAPVEDESVCGKVNLATLAVQFLYFAPGNLNAPASKKDVAVTVDTVGPRPPTGLTTKPGNTRIQVAWNNISGEGGVTNLTGVKVYCDRATAAPPTTIQTDGSCELVPREASVDPDGAVSEEDAGFEEVCTEGETTTIAGSDCTSPNFVRLGPDGQPEEIVPDVDFDRDYACGASVGNTGSTANATEVGGNPLTNGVQYAVAVAATDQFGNVGILSSPLCETPEETTDFWEGYRSAGGGAGGGFCSTTGAGMPVGSVAAIALACAVAMSTLRRRTNKGRR